MDGDVVENPGQLCLDPLRRRGADARDASWDRLPPSTILGSNLLDKFAGSIPNRI
jgi:hypothetical protein